MMFVGRPVPNIQAADMNEPVLPSFLEHTLGKCAGTKVRKEREYIEANHLWLPETRLPRVLYRRNALAASWTRPRPTYAKCPRFAPKNSQTGTVRLLSIPL